MPKIVAYFKNMHDAKKTVHALEKEGFHGAYLDAHDMFEAEFTSESLNGETISSPSLSKHLYKKITSSHGRTRKSLIYSTLPILTDNPEDIKSHISTRLIINADDDNEEQILEIIKKSGGNIPR